MVIWSIPSLWNYNSSLYVLIKFSPLWKRNLCVVCALRWAEWGSVFVICSNSWTSSVFTMMDKEDGSNALDIVRLHICGSGQSDPSSLCISMLCGFIFNCISICPNSVFVILFFKTFTSILYNSRFRGLVNNTVQVTLKTGWVLTVIQTIYDLEIQDSSIFI